MKMELQYNLTAQVAPAVAHRLLQMMMRKKVSLAVVL